MSGEGCPECGGTGRKNGTAYLAECDFCGGTGRLGEEPSKDTGEPTWTGREVDLLAERAILRADLSTARAEVERLRAARVGIEERLDRAYAEIRKQTFASKVVFDREIVEEAEKRNPGLRPGMEDVP